MTMKISISWDEIIEYFEKEQDEVTPYDVLIKFNAVTNFVDGFDDEQDKIDILAEIKEYHNEMD